MARALIDVPRTAKRGDVIDVRATVAHPMETGQRRDGEGRLLPRDIVTRFECRWDGELVFAADLHPAVSANPMVAFSTVATASGTLVFSWSGDNGFAHSESVAITVA